MSNVFLDNWLDHAANTIRAEAAAEKVDEFSTDRIITLLLREPYKHQGFSCLADLVSNESAIVAGLKTRRIKQGTSGAWAISTQRASKKKASKKRGAKA